MDLFLKCAHILCMHSRFNKTRVVAPYGTCWWKRSICVPVPSPIGVKYVKISVPSPVETIVKTELEHAPVPVVETIIKLQADHAPVSFPVLSLV